MRFRAATKEDKEILLAWRNDPLTRQNSINTDLVSKEAHHKWLTESLVSARRKIFIAVENQKKIGTVRFDKREGEVWELSWTVAPELRGQGYGKMLVQKASKLYPVPLVARISKRNESSKKIALSAGFVPSVEDGGICTFVLAGRTGLFKPNDLSISTPPLQELTSEQPSRIIQDHFAAAWPCEIKEIRTQSATSQNYLVLAKDKKYVLKRRFGQPGFDCLKEEARRSYELKALKCPVVEFIGRPIIVSGCDDAWALTIYYEGKHFSGSQAQLASAAEAFSSISAKLKNFKFEGLTKIFNPEDLENLVQKHNIEKAGDPRISEIWNEVSPKVLKDLDRIKSCRFEKDIQFIHTDFHPANLLFQGDNLLSILDLEDVIPFPQVAANGFAAYKLIRQVITQKNSAENVGLYVNIWLENWNKIRKDAPIKATDLEMGARYRILNLIYLILSTYFDQGSDRFNYDFAKHVTSLYELDVIYGVA